jgi:hypothetical protein
LPQRLEQQAERPAHPAGLVVIKVQVHRITRLPSRPVTRS